MQNSHMHFTEVTANIFLLLLFIMEIFIFIFIYYPWGKGGIKIEGINKDRLTD